MNAKVNKSLLKSQLNLKSIKVKVYYSQSPLDLKSIKVKVNQN